MRKTRTPLLTTLLMFILCTTILVGATTAYFTETVQVSGNVVQSGNLKAEMYWTDSLVPGENNEIQWIDASKETADDTAIFSYEQWEPGFTAVRFLQIRNAGRLAFQYQLNVLPQGALIGKANLMDAIDVYYGVVPQLDATAQPSLNVKDYATFKEFTDTLGLERMGTLSQLNANTREHTWGVMLPSVATPNAELPVGVTASTGAEEFCIVLHMQEDAGNEYQQCGIEKGFVLQLTATQYTYEKDSFGHDYDTEAVSMLPVYTSPVTVTADITGKVSTEGTLTEAVTLSSGDVSATVPAGALIAPGATSLTLRITPMALSGANLTLGQTEETASYDVHVEGIDPANTLPVTITMGEVLPTGLNMGNYRLHHVENGETVEMNYVASGELAKHNDFKYDPATGFVTVAMAQFSEVAVVAEPSKWEGEFDYSWYDASKSELTIANADQLAGFGAIVGGMAKDENGNALDRDSFSGKTVKLIADIDLGDKNNANDSLIFHPIGYYYTDDKNADGTTGDYYSTVNSFQGTFDGNGHTIANFYHNTWEIKGDYDGNYYKDGMGLFGYVVNGKVCNLTVDNFSSDGEFTPTGVIAAYAVNSTFENIAITNCNPRVYNTGNGGIIGVAGNSNDQGTQITLKNITVDNSNKISALWGSWDVACGGLVGMFRGNADGGTGKIHFENCHVSAQIDVYNDVCANYQYYAYRYAGMMIGSIRHNTTNADGKTIPNMAGVSASGCTVNYGDWNDYYYCEFVDNSIASYTHDYQFSRVNKSDIIFDANGKVTGCTHDHTKGGYETTDINGDGVIDSNVLKEDKTAVYLPFHQLFTGYSWGVSSVGLEKYSGITVDEWDLDIGEGKQEKSDVKFESKFTGDFLYRVGNQNTVALGSLFAATEGVTISNSGVWVSIEAVDEDMNVSGAFTANTSEWEKGTIQFSGTGVVKVTIQDYNFCKPTVLYLEVVDATNITSATGTTTGGDMVLLCDVNTTTYVNYWNCTLYGNGFTYSLNGAPTAYNSKQGHGVLITKNATLDNLVIVGDVYNSYGAYTNQDYYNAAVDVVGDTVIQNCYISGCAAPVSTRANATITDTTLYGGTVGNLIIKSGTVTLGDVTTANYDDGRTLVGMGIVIHSDATESAKLVLNGTLTQYNFMSESKVPTDTYAKNLHTTMFSDSCSKYHFGTSPNRYVNTGIVSLTALFNAEDITDNANTGYVGTPVKVSEMNGYVYTQPNTSGSVNNDYDKKNDPHVSTTQGTVAPTYNFDYTTKNYVAKTDGSNDYCYEENGIVYISMDEGDTFNWDTSILTATKVGQTLSYMVSMNNTYYTGKSITFNTAGDYEVVYTYNDPNNFVLDDNGNITTYSKPYTKTVNISVAVIEAATKHAEFTFGNNTASTTVTVGNNTYVMPNVSATSSTVGSTIVDGKTVYYPIVEIIMSDGKTSHTSGWYAYFPVFSGAVTITDYKDNGLGDAETFGSSTQSMPSGLSIVGDPAQLFKYQSSSTAGTSPVVKNNILVYSSPSISAKRSEYNTVIQYSYQDNAGTTYYYYIGYHAPAQSYSSCLTPSTLITLADGSQKEIQHLTYDDQLLAWDMFTGSYVATPIAKLIYHGDAEYEVLQLNFSDGTNVEVINEHGFFDADLNKFVFINKNNATACLGHQFIQRNADGYSTVTFESYNVTTQYTGSYSIVSASCNNAIANGMLSLTPANVTDSDRFFNYLTIGDNLTYDADALAHDIATYGLFNYDDLAEYMTKDEYAYFEATGGCYWKIAIGKGNLTMDEFLGTFLNEAQ